MLGCFSPIFGSNADKSKCWVKKVIEKIDPWFVLISPKIEVKQPSIFF